MGEDNGEQFKERKWGEKLSVGNIVSGWFFP